MPLDRKMFVNKLDRYMAQLQVSIQDIAAGTGISIDRITSILTCASDPTGDEVLILADYFHCDFKFFISNEKLAPFEQTESLFRRYSHDLTREDRWAIQEFLFLCECQEFLLSELIGRPRDRFIFQKIGSFYKGHGEAAAEALRCHLGYDSNEIPKNVYEVFRTIGIHIFRRLLGRSNISGVFIMHPIAGPCILVNYSEDVFRQRFTACHEAGHALLDEGEDFVVSFAKWDNKDLSEIRANTFASRFLMPPEVLRTVRVAWSETIFLEYATRLMVNAEPLAYALLDLKTINKKQAVAFKKLKIPVNVKNDPELPSSLAPRVRQRKQELLHRGLSDAYVGLCFDAYERGIISASRLAEMLLIVETELFDIAALYGRHLSHGD